MNQCFRSRRVTGILVLLAAAGAHSQTITASLGGTVKDPTGAVVPDATIQIVNSATKVARVFKSGNNGQYLAPSLPVGTYEIRVTAAGFKSAQSTGIVLDVAQSARLDLSLEVGTVAETLEVHATNPLLQTADSSQGLVVDSRNIENLPLNSRVTYNLVLLAPGVHGSIGTGYNSVNISINGGRPGSNEILLDGVPSSPPEVNYVQSFTAFPPVDAVQEFKVQTTGYSAEFGHSGGGIINLVYKSGTNTLHGSMFEFLRNSVLDANDFFSNANRIALGSFKRNQFGASLGGPVLLPRIYNGRNKTFFFADYEGLRQRSAAPATFTVPTALQRMGDFSQTRNAAGALVVIYDPVSTVPSGSGFVRTPFLNNVIPPNRIDKVAANVVKYYPLPNRAGDPNTGTNNYSGTATSPQDIDTYDVKVDENLNDKNRFFVRYSHRKLLSVSSSIFPADIRIADGGTRAPQTSNNGAFDYTWTASPTFLMDFRAGFGRTLLGFVPYSAGFDPTSLGFPSYLAAHAEALMFPGFLPTGYRSLGNFNPDYRHNAFETVNGSINNTKVLQRHLLKFGFDDRILLVNDHEISQGSGAFSFSKAPTQGPNPNSASATAGDGLASLLLGVGSSGNIINGFKDVASKSNYYAWYLADDWKVSSRLTLNIGVRYDLQTPRTERYDRMNYFDPNVASPLAGRTGISNLKGGLVFVGVNGNSRSQFDLQTNNISPRFGFAFQATKRLVVRGGYGIFYAPALTSAGGTVGNFGFRADTPYVGLQDNLTPANYLSNPFPTGFVAPVGSSQGLSSSLGTAISAPLRATKVPYTENWNLNIQYELPGGILVEAGYVANRGLQLNQSGEGTYNLNQLTPAQLTLGNKLQQSVPNPFFGIVTTGALAAKTVQAGMLLAPFPQYPSVFPLYLNGSSSNFQSLQIKVERRFSKGLSALLTYTFDKLIDDYSIIANAGRNAGIQNIYDRHSERSVSPNDISQSLLLTSVYEIPIGRGRLLGKNWNRVTDFLIGGWQVNGILTLQTGFPLALSTQNTSGAGGAVLRPNTNGQSAALSAPDNQRLARYFNTSVFSQPAPFTFGNVGRTLPDVRGPGVHNLDFSAFKNFSIKERAKVQFRGEFFNLTNTPTFSLPDQVFSSSTFGRITSTAGSPRQVQFALKLLF
ncbi:MAG: TonB-dependent receptor [Acidobacteriota bacterium]|nr:TonB-dependent receptor [Acidobacteriota bacterium]